MPKTPTESVEVLVKNGPDRCGGRDYYEFNAQSGSKSGCMLDSSSVFGVLDESVRKFHPRQCQWQVKGLQDRSRVSSLLNR